MDRRDPMALSGTQSYYMQQNQSGTQSPLQQGSHTGLRSITNPNMPFQANAGGPGNIGPTSLPIETTASSGLSPHQGVNLSGGGASSGEPVKRKRGRPRKYGPDGGGGRGGGPVSLALSPSSSATQGGSQQKRSRGRPPGSGKKHQLTSSFGGLPSGSAGVGFTPHIITIGVGEDIATKIMSFSQQGPRTVCVLSANGAVSTVTLRQPSVSGGTVTYEGRFEIVCLSGSFLVTDSGGTRNRSGGLNVSLASPDGRIIGGGVGGVLIAASPIQVIVGSFMWGSSKAKNDKKREAEGGVIDSDRNTMDNNMDPLSNVPPHAPTNLVGVWPLSQQVDIRNAHHIDIDLMRG